MKGFGTFDTTNTLYGSFYSRQQDPVTNIPKYSKPDMEEQYYFKTLEMQKGYFNRYAHLYEDPTGKPIYNPIDSKAFKEEDAQGAVIPNEMIPQQHVENDQIQNEKEIGEEPVMKTFHRNYEAQQE